MKRGLIVAAALLVLCCGGGALAAAQILALAGGATESTCGNPGVLNAELPLPAIGELAQAQIRNAAIIIAVGQQRKILPRGWIIAVATALQESRLFNLANTKVPASMALPHEGAGHDHDSVGLFQQRPLPPDGAGGWGTVAELMTPSIAASKFYAKLLTITGWALLPLTIAAQKVQVSCCPYAYAKHEPLATLIVATLVPGAAAAAGSAADLHCAQPGEIAASGWTIPLRGKVGSGFRTADRPTHQGVDIIVGKGTTIVAASSGVVRTVKCNIEPTSWGCDRDGHPELVRGCGWYVEIAHAGGIITRYCHMRERPSVSVGQTVVAGQPIGVSGSSGHSSGPHLHYEVHVNGDASSNGAIDPVEFMKKVGAPL